MNIEQIRSKYKQILEEPQSQNSGDQWEQAYSEMQKKRNKRILTETNRNITFKNIKLLNAEEKNEVITAKEKLAQCIVHLNQKNKEIHTLKDENLKKVETNRLLELQIVELKETIQKLHKEGLQKQISFENLKKDYEGALNQVEQISIDNQMLHKQIDFYKEQVDQLKSHLAGRAKQFLKIQKDIKSIEKLKNDNLRYKDDIGRLSSIIQESYRFGRVSQELLKKHFLGKPYKQFDYWYAENLIGEVELFLKKHQIGYGNKEFTNNLIKFIDRYSKQLSKQVEKKVRQSCSSRVRQSSIKKQYKSINTQTNDSWMKKSLKLKTTIINKMRKPISNTLTFWRTPTESNIICGRYERPINDQRQQKRSSQTQNSLLSCYQTLQEFKNIMYDLLNDKEVKRRKMMKIIESMCVSIIDLFQQKLNLEDSNSKVSQD